MNYFCKPRYPCTSVACRVEAASLLHKDLDRIEFLVLEKDADLACNYRGLVKWIRLASPRFVSRLSGVVISTAAGLEKWVSNPLLLYSPHCQEPCPSWSRRFMCRHITLGGWDRILELYCPNIVSRNLQIFKFVCHPVALQTWPELCSSHDQRASWGQGKLCIASLILRRPSGIWKSSLLIFSQKPMVMIFSPLRWLSTCGQSAAPVTFRGNSPAKFMGLKSVDNEPGPVICCMVLIFVQQIE